MADGTEINREDMREILDMVSTICERIAAALRNCDNFELETCERRLEEHLRVLAAVSVSRSISSALSSQSRGLFGDLIDGVAILLNSISNYLNCKIQKETKRTTAPITRAQEGDQPMIFLKISWSYCGKLG